MPKIAVATDPSDLISRLQRLIQTVEMDPASTAALAGALARFSSLEHRRSRRKALADAREQKDSIIARLAFLSELDEITDRETDSSIFEEIALLFDEIATAGAYGAIAIRSAGFLGVKPKRLSH